MGVGRGEIGGPFVDDPEGEGRVGSGAEGCGAGGEDLGGGGESWAGGDGEGKG